MIQALQCLPGVGIKSAQRMALHLLERDRRGGKNLAKSLYAAIDNIKKCYLCRNFCEGKLCTICANEHRDHSLICVVETPADLISIEQIDTFYGLYFVLLGRLSPIEGIGPEELGINLLLERIQSNNVQEVILAMSATVEGEATAYFLSEHMKKMNIQVSRIAHGVPVGGELEYIDEKTLSYAIKGRVSC